MSLAKMLLEGTASNLTASEASRYSADEGAAILAMESAELLQDIFMESECKENEIVLNAALEGYAPDSEIVQEGVGSALKGALDKVIAWFKKMKDGVVAFFKNVAKYLDKVFLSGKDFVKKYKSELQKKDLDGLTYTMYKYDDNALNNLDKETSIKNTESECDKVINTISDNADTMMKAGKSSADWIKGYREKNPSGELGEDPNGGKGKEAEAAKYTLKSNYERHKENYRKKKIEILNEVNVEDIDTENPTTSGVTDAFIKKYRGGAESESDKEELDVVIRDSINIVEKTSSYISIVNTMMNKVKTKYDKGIKEVEKIQREADKLGTNDNLSYVSKSIGLCTDMLSFYQNFENAALTAWKSVLSERYKVHTSIVKKALTYKPKKD